MPTFDIIFWDSEDDADGNVQHIARHGVTKAEVEDVLYDPASRDTVSRSSWRPATIGTASTGRTIFVTYEREERGSLTILTPITAYPIT